MARKRATKALAKKNAQASESGESIDVDSTESKKPKSDPYAKALLEYNAAYTRMNDHGLTLLRQRERTVDLIEFVESLINSIANTPKSFETNFEQIHIAKLKFRETEEFARRDLKAARKAASGTGAGFAAATAVATMAPTGALWVATTFGTASTGTAISTLSGAAASNAALAWLGGGTLAAGGSGVAGGTALLALAGPVGWTIAGASVLTSITLFAHKKYKNRKLKNDELTAIKKNTAVLNAVDAQIRNLVDQSGLLRDGLVANYSDALEFFDSDFLSLTPTQQSRLGTLVNNTLATATLLTEHIEQASDNDEG